MREWIYDDCGGIVPSRRRIVVRIQAEGEDELDGLGLWAAIRGAMNCVRELGVGSTIHTPGPIPKWWPETEEKQPTAPILRSEAP